MNDTHNDTPNETDESLERELPPLVTMGDPELARPSPPVDVARLGTAEFLELVGLLRECMAAYQGVAIAAPQIGWFERLFVMTEPAVDESGEETMRLVNWVNPEIFWRSGEQNWSWEGCLSVPDLRGWLRRPAAVSVRGLDEHGQTMSREFTGWNARVFQHEFDHLDGVLFPYRVQDPRHLVTLEAMAGREDWPQDWPAPGARDTPVGQVMDE
ncbi:MAG: peptide deformylase [SAR324 cluster bacterium]|nr:peptide deformylase [SAR324 cluster bacterium]